MAPVLSIVKQDTRLYDGRGNPATVTDALGNTASCVYSDDNRLITLIDARGSITRYSCDDRGNLLSITYPDTTREVWEYNGLNQVISFTNGRQERTEYVRNIKGRILSKVFPDGTSEEYAYDMYGNIIRVKDPSGRMSFTYDPLTRDLTRIDYPFGKYLAFTYDTEGRRTSIKDEEGHCRYYGYGYRGWLETVRDETGHVLVTLTYDGEGRLVRKELGNKVVTHYLYDARGRLISLTNDGPDGATLSRFHYVYGRNGRPASLITLDGTWSYTCDDAGQLIHARFTPVNPLIPDRDLRYAYDAMGNRTEVTENGVTTICTTNAMNQYTRIGDTSFFYDEDGNLVKEVSPRGETSYRYDSQNRLIGITSPKGSFSYTCNAFGHRVASIENGIMTRYVTDPWGLGLVTGEYDETGRMTARYAYDNDTLLCRSTDDTWYFYTFGNAGNTSEVTLPDGTLANRYVYGPFGSLIMQSESIPNRFCFVGEKGVMTDPSGLLFMRARYYDARTGRFTARDPIGIEGGINLYAYCLNDPVMNSDPSGLWMQPGHKELTMQAGNDVKFDVDDLRIVANNNVTADTTNFFYDWAHYMPGTARQAYELYQNAFKLAVKYERIYVLKTVQRLGEIRQHFQEDLIREAIYKNHELHIEALVALGVCLHVVQDYWAHYIQNAAFRLKDGGHGPADNDNPGKHPNEYAEAYKTTMNFFHIFSLATGARNAKDWIRRYAWKSSANPGNVWRYSHPDLVEMTRNMQKAERTTIESEKAYVEEFQKWQNTLLAEKFIAQILAGNSSWVADTLYPMPPYKPGPPPLNETWELAPRPPDDLLYSMGQYVPPKPEKEPDSSKDNEGRR